MKKVLKTIILTVLAVICTVGMVACDSSSRQNSGNSGITGAVVNGVYEVRRYYAEDGVDSLDLGKIELPSGVTEIKIKANAFKDNASLKSIIVPSNTIEVGSGAFAGMTKLEKLEVPFIGKTFNAEYKANLSNTDDIAKAVNEERTVAHYFGTEEFDGGSSVTVNYGASTKTIYIPTTLKTIIVNNGTEKGYNIPKYAFNGVTAFNSIQLQGNIIGIGEYAFGGVGGIDLIKIPASVKTIYAGAFSASYIKNFVFDAESSAVVVEEEAFKDCSLLNYVGASNLEEKTIDLAKFSKEDLGRDAFELSINEINYTIKNSNGVDKEKVFGETEITVK